MTVMAWVLRQAYHSARQEGGEQTTRPSTDSYLLT